MRQDLVGQKAVSPCTALSINKRKPLSSLCSSGEERTHPREIQREGNPAVLRTRAYFFR